MKTALIIVAALAGLLILGGIGVAHYQSQAEEQKYRAEHHISPGFQVPARHALQLLEQGNVRNSDVATAMALASAAQSNIADRMAMASVEAVHSSLLIYRGHETDKEALRTCLESSHSLLESGEETNSEVLERCNTALKAQVDEQQKQLHLSH